MSALLLYHRRLYCTTVAHLIGLSPRATDLYFALVAFFVVVASLAPRFLRSMLPHQLERFVCPINKISAAFFVRVELPPAPPPVYLSPFAPALLFPTRLLGYVLCCLPCHASLPRALTNGGVVAPVRIYITTCVDASSRPLSQLTTRCIRLPGLAVSPAARFYPHPSCAHVADNPSKNAPVTPPGQLFPHVHTHIYILYIYLYSYISTENCPPRYRWLHWFGGCGPSVTQRRSVLT